MFIQSIDNFRALSIIIIVIGHVFWISGFNTEDDVSKFYISLISGGTFYFVFISGFLFEKLSFEEFSFSKFMLRKFKVVFLPYLFISFLPIIIAISLRNVYPQYFFDNHLSGFYYDYIKPYFMYVFTGRVLTGYWYIPFVFLIFLSSPILVIYNKLSIKQKVYLFVAFIILSGFVFRSVDNINPFQSFVYFLPIFLLGIIVANFHQELSKTPLSIAFSLLFLSFFISYFQIEFNNIFGNQSKNFFDYQGYDFRVLEKSIQSVSIYLFLERFRFKLSFFSLVAKASFAIYFLHPLFIFIINKINQGYFHGFFYLQITSAIVLFLCIVSALLFKYIFKGKSRYLIGY